MNKVAKNFFLWLFVLMISISFIAYFGVSGDPIASQPGKIGMVNGVEIFNTRNSEFADNYQLFYENYQSQGIEIDDQASQYISQQALRQTILNQLVVEKAQEDFFEVSDKTKLEFIVQTYFNNNVKEFKEFQATGDLAVQTQIEKKITRRLKRLFYEQTLFSSIPVSQKAVDLILRISRLEKKVAVARLDVKASISNQVNDKVLRDYYNQNINRYQRKTTQQTPTSGLGSDSPLFLDLGVSNQNSNEPSSDNFELSREQVLADYQLENESVLIDEIKNNIDFKFKTIGQSTGNRGKEFLKTARGQGMEVQVSDYFNYDSRTINQLRVETPITSSVELIKNLFTLNKNEISEPYPIGDEFMVFYVMDEKKSPAKSGFVKNRYVDNLKSQVQNRIANAFYVSLYDKAEIVMEQRQP